MKKSLFFFEFIKGLSYEDNHFKQFKYRVEAILCGQLHHDYEKALEIFNKALRLTIKFTEILDIEFCYLSVEELTIINDIALCYDALNSKKAILLMETVLKSIEKNDFLINDCFRFYYNLGLMYSHHKYYIKMESISLEGIKKCLKSNEFITLAYLYYNHFIASYLLNNIDMALEELNNSYVLFKMQGKTKAITDVLLTDIQKYQMNIQLSDIKSYGE